MKNEKNEKNEIKYVKGDVTNPYQVEGRKILVHVCNDIGLAGAGVIVAIKRKWPEAIKEYQRWFRSRKGFELGRVQFIKVEDDIVVCNMIGQKGVRSRGNQKPIRYSAIEDCLGKVCEGALRNEATIICPRFGCGLAGGSWNRIEEIIEEKLCKKGVQVVVYDL